MAATCAAQATPPTQVQFSVTFMATPTDSVNHASVGSQVTKTAITDAGVSFQQATGDDGAKLLWVSSLVG